MFKRLLATLSLVTAPALAQDMPLYDASQFGQIVVSHRQSGLSQPQYEALIGNSSLELMSDINPGSAIGQLGRAVGKLDILTDTNKYAPCTAFLVADNLLITNHHCVPGVLDHPQIGGNVIAALEFHAGFIRDGIASGAKTFRVSPVPLETNKQLDYAVLRVIGDANAEFGALKLSAAPPEDADPFLIIGHPQGWAQRLSREQCQAATPAVEGDRVLHSCDTMPGSSGSPVIDDDTRQVVALHSAAAGGVNLAVPMAEILKASDVLKPTQAAAPAPQVDLAALAAERAAAAAENAALLARVTALQAENARLTQQQAVAQDAEASVYSSELISSFPEGSPLRQLARAVGRLEIETPVGSVYCTGFLLGNGLLMTRMYCFPGGIVESKPATFINSVTFQAGSAEGGDLSDYSVSSHAVETNETDGWAILAVDGAPETQFGALTLSTDAPPSTGPLWLIHYPEGSGPYVSRAGCTADGAEVRYKIALIHGCETKPGSMGAPLIDPASGKVIAQLWATEWYQPGKIQTLSDQPSEALLARRIVQRSKHLIKSKCRLEMSATKTDFLGNPLEVEICPEVYPE